MHACYKDVMKVESLLLLFFGKHKYGKNYLLLLLNMQKRQRWFWYSYWYRVPCFVVSRDL